MCKIINKHWNVPQINLVLQGIFQNNPFAGFKRKKNLTRNYRNSYDQKCLKPIQKTETENVNLATQVNHHYVASMTLVHSEVTKHSNYIPYFTS